LVAHHGTPFDGNSHTEEPGFLLKQNAAAAVQFRIAGTLHHPPVDKYWICVAIKNPFIA
jgi:hypothetical protein